MAGYLRSLGSNRFGAALAGLVYQLSGFLIASALFPMVAAAAVWLPLALWIGREHPAWPRLVDLPRHRNSWVVIGAVAIACNILAGAH